MSCKFKGITYLTADCYSVDFLVDGRERCLEYSSFDGLMQVVLDQFSPEPISEWEAWLEYSELPTTYGYFDGNSVDDCLKYAAAYFKDCEESFVINFEINDEDKAFI